jgi:putative sigma-54 modulation protein
LLFTISGKHIEITDAIRKHVEQKTAKLPRYYDSINRIEVVIDGANPANTSVELIASAEHNKIFVVTESDPDAYKSIDMAFHKLENQLRKKKSRERDNKHAGEE